MAKEYFDVRDVRPGSIQDSIGTRSINLMCAILRGIPYRQLYDEPFHWKPSKDFPESTLDRIIYNIENLPKELQVGATNKDLIVLGKLVGDFGAFTKIRGKFEEKGYPRLELKELFYIDPDDQIETPKWSVAKYIIRTLEDVHEPDPDTGEDQMYHFCVPFLTIQKHRVPLPDKDPNSKRPAKHYPKDQHLKDFLKDLGHLEMEALYNRNTTDYTKLRGAAKKALDRCILKEHGRKNKPQVHIQIVDGNKKYCTGTDAGCATCSHADDWCNDYYINGSSGPKQCSLGSDYHIL